MVRRVGQQLHGRLLRDRSPRPGGEVGRQRAFPAVGERARGCVGVVAGHAHQRQGGQLGVEAAAAGGGLAGEETGRAVGQLLDLGGRIQAHQGRCLACRADAAGVHREAGLAPGVCRADDLRVEQRGGEQRAALVGVALREPGGACGVAHVLAVEVPGEQGVAGDLAVVVHAKARVVGAEPGPVVSVAELEQPIVAQAVLDVAAAPALVERVDLVLRDLGDAVAQLPVVGPHRERMLRRERGRAVGDEARLVLLAERFPCVDDGIARDLRVRARRDHECAADQES